MSRFAAAGGEADRFMSDVWPAVNSIMRIARFSGQITSLMQIWLLILGRFNVRVIAFSVILLFRKCLLLGRRSD